MPWFLYLAIMFFLGCQFAIVLLLISTAAALHRLNENTTGQMVITHGRLDEIANRISILTNVILEKRINR